MTRNPVIFLFAMVLAGLAFAGIGFGAFGATGAQAAAPRPADVSALPGGGCVPWQLVPSENPQTFESHLNSVSAVSANDIWAAGYFFGESLYGQTLIEHWDGTAWTIVSSPNPGTANNLLFGIAAISANDAWAVGWKTSTNIQQPLFLHWDGTSWTEQEQTIDRPRVVLQGISGRASNDIWAVGLSCETPICNRHVTAAVHYDGTSWSIVDSPNPGQFDNYFWGVKVRAANDAWAVGEVCTDPGCSTSQSLVEHWDGTAWSAVSSPSPGATENFLSGVDAIAADDAWAVGSACEDTGCSSVHSLALHYDGTAWTQVTSPNPGTMDTHLNDVVMSSSDDVWAVGSQSSDGSVYSNAMLHWDGTTWSDVTVTSPGSVDNNLLGVAKVTSNDVWTVGDSQNESENYRTQVQHYTGPCGGTPTATPALTSTSTSTATATAVPPSATATSTVTATASPQASATPCAISFSDVQPSDYFYGPVSYLYCHGAISGYSDRTFRPFNTTTRGQLSKIIVLAERWTIDTTGGPHFSDVPTTNTFYPFIETAYNHNIISGYSDGTFRWGNSVTRAQLAKIVVSAEGWAIDTTGGPHFSDVPTADPFYGFVETAYNHTVISGYSDGTFKPGNSATRGQIAKIVYNAVTQP